MYFCGCGEQPTHKFFEQQKIMQMVAMYLKLSITACVSVAEENGAFKFSPLHDFQIQKA